MFTIGTSGILFVYTSPLVELFVLLDVLYSCQIKFLIANNYNRKVNNFKSTETRFKLTGNAS